jgi:hypothetical protein
MFDACIRVFQHPNPSSLIDQQRDQMTANEARATCDECIFHVATSSVIGTKRSDYRENAEGGLSRSACSAGVKWGTMLQWMSGVSWALAHDSAKGRVFVRRSFRKELPMRGIWVIGILALVVAVTASLGGQTPQGGEAKDAGGDNFAGKIIVVTTAKTQNTLKNVQIRKLGDRSFLVGISVRDTNVTREDFPNRPIWLPVSDLTEIVEFDDLAQLRRVGNTQP